MTEAHEHEYGDWMQEQRETVDWDYVVGYVRHIRTVQIRRCNKCGWAQEAPVEKLAPAKEPA